MNFYVSYAAKTTIPGIKCDTTSYGFPHSRKPKVSSGIARAGSSDASNPFIGGLRHKASQSSGTVMTTLEHQQALVNDQLVMTWVAWDKYEDELLRS